MVEIIPLWLVNALSFATVFSVMTSIGTTITPALFLAHIRSPGLLLRGLLCVLAIVPAAGFAAGFAFGLAPGEKVGVALMAIAPGAPLALRRALGSGGDAGFSPTLQIMVALLAIVAMPAWVAVGNALLGTNGFVNVAAVAKQVGIAQLLPLGVGALMEKGLKLGADGIVPSVGNLIPDVCQKLCVAAQDGKWSDAEIFYSRMSDVAAVYQKGRTLNESLAALKAAVSCRGLCASIVLQPLQSLAEMEVEKIRGVMEQLHLLNGIV